MERMACWLLVALALALVGRTGASARSDTCMHAAALRTGARDSRPCRAYAAEATCDPIIKKVDVALFSVSAALRGQAGGALQPGGGCEGRWETLDIRPRGSRCPALHRAPVVESYVTQRIRECSTHILSRGQIFAALSARHAAPPNTFRVKRPTCRSATAK